MDKYILQKADRTICPKCDGEDIRLLCPEHYSGNQPGFYLCRCGYVGQVGVGAVPVIKEESEGE